MDLKTFRTLFSNRMCSSTRNYNEICSKQAEKTQNSMKMQKSGINSQSQQKEKKEKQLKLTL